MELTPQNDQTAAPTREIFSISQLNRRVRQILETQFPLIWVEGEISNFSRPGSGHWYFTLKDESAQVRCCMFRNRNQTVRMHPEHGQKVLIRARVGLYEGRGDYQLIAEHMEPAGLGDLQRQFELLKQKLANAGLFEGDRKRPLPTIPKHIAVITSPSGAALQDILHVTERRFPIAQVTVIPAIVQGNDSAASLVYSLDLANNHTDADVIIMGRGGGSIEDLWSFNEESVAYAIANSRIPVVSCVGHETDFTISDFVADVRAPTPSAAAEIATPDQESLFLYLDNLSGRFSQNLGNRLSALQQKLNHLRATLEHPGQRLQVNQQRLSFLSQRLAVAMDRKQAHQTQRLERLNGRLLNQNPAARIENIKMQLNRCKSDLTRSAEKIVELRRHRLAAASSLLDSVSPLRTLDRGYSITMVDQKPIKSATEVTPGATLETRLSSGVVVSTVTQIAEP